MTIRNLVFYPDQRLKTVCEPVKEVTKDIEELVNDMFDTMYHTKGVGLAAPQIGICKMISVIDATEDKNQQLCLINPEILEVKGSENMKEGCLSVPGVHEMIKRATWVKMKALDIKGKPYELEAEGLLAECIQHEIDHLNGILYIDKLSSLKRQRVIIKMKKFIKNN